MSEKKFQDKLNNEFFWSEDLRDLSSDIVCEMNI